MNATAKQLQHIHAALHRLGLLRHKADMVSSYTNGRTSSSREMTAAEAQEMLATLNDHQPDEDKRQKMVKHIIAMAHEMGWIKESGVVSQESGVGTLKKKKDYSDLHAWVEKYGYLKKPLNKYSYAELPNLVTAFKNVYAAWLKKSR